MAPDHRLLLVRRLVRLPRHNGSPSGQITRPPLSCRRFVRAAVTASAPYSRSPSLYALLPAHCSLLTALRSLLPHTHFSRHMRYHRGGTTCTYEKKSRKR